jgi:hypothetical protein
MNDEPDRRATTDLAASEALDAALGGAAPVDLPDEVRRRVEQFDSVRKRLEGDSDAPSSSALEGLVSNAMAAFDGKAEVGGARQDRGGPDDHTAPVPVSSLDAHRARRLRRVLAVAAGAVVLAGGSWYLTHSSTPDETAEDSSAGDSSAGDPSAGTDPDLSTYPQSDLRDPAAPDAAPSTLAPSTEGDASGGASEAPTPGSSSEQSDSAGATEHLPPSGIWSALIDRLFGSSDP